MSEQAQGDRAELLEDAADDLERYRTEHIVPCLGYTRYDQLNKELITEIKGLRALAGELPLLEAVVAATRALTRWNHRHACGDCELAGLCDVCNDADNALHKLDAHRAGSAKAAGEGVGE